MVLTLRREPARTGLSGDEIISWCYRNGGETYGREERPGIVCHFPDADERDRIGYLPERESFQVITDGRFYVTHSIHEQGEGEIDRDDRLRIETADWRIVVDPR